MGFQVFDRVKDTSTTTGTGTLTLANSAPSSYRTFGSVLSNSDTTYYCIEHQTANEWETGLGTYTTSGTTLARTTVYQSSNSNNAVDFSAGTKNVFIPVPANKWQTLTNLTGTYANLPSAGIAGRSYLCTDSIYSLYDNGTTWDHFYQGIKVTPIVSGDWSWINQDSATETTTYGDSIIYHAAYATTNQLNLRVRTDAGASYTRTFGIIPAPFPLHYAFAFIGWRNSTDGKCQGLLYGSPVGGGSPQSGWLLVNWASATSIGTITSLGNVAGFYPTVLWVKLVDDYSSTREIWVSSAKSPSYDSWIKIDSRSRTDHVTPNQVCYGIDAVSRDTKVRFFDYE